MKNRISLFLVGILLIGSATLFAQKPFVGDITYGYSAVGTTDVNVTSQLATTTTSEIVMGNCTKNVNGGLIEISNGDDNTVLIVLDLTSNAMGKYYILQNKEDLDKMFAKVKYDYQYTEDEKTIAGYKCKKVILTKTNLETDEQSTEVLWVTNDLMLGDNINFAGYPGLKGYPLRSEVKKEDSEGNSFTLVQEATQLTPNKKVKSSNFLRPADAKPISEAPEELKSYLKPLLAAMGIEL